MQTTKIVLSAAGIAVGIVLGMLVQPVISDDNIYNQLRKFKEVLTITTSNYVEEVDPTKLVEAGIRAVLADLDVHSVYIPPLEKKQNDEDFQGSFEGIGVSFDIIRDTITVIEPIGGGPSARLGIRSGDKIVKIDGTSAIGVATNDVMKRLKGPKGSQVSVHIRRPGDQELLQFNITRDKIPLYTVDASFLVDKSDIGYIRINRFAATTHKEVVEAARTLKTQGMKRLILDLRWNPGGYLDQAFKIADEFIRDGNMIVYTQGRRPEFNHEFYATAQGDLEKIPLVVLINENSASASEIVAGAIQDLDRGLIVGRTSFGKGLVQQQYDLDDGSAFRLTTSRYYTPSGRSIQRPYYRDKEKYYNGEGREEIEEGDNISHAGDKSDSTRPVYKTTSGRTVHGGGGIVPDYVIKGDTLSPLYIALVRKDVFSEFIDSYLAGNGAELRTRYGKDFPLFLNSYTVDASIIETFKAIAIKEGVEWDEKQFALDAAIIKTSIKAQIARSLWGTGESVAVTLSDDRQFLKAKELFPEASKIARLR